MTFARLRGLARSGPFRSLLASHDRAAPSLPEYFEAHALATARHAERWRHGFAVRGVWLCVEDTGARAWAFAIDHLARVGLIDEWH